MAEHMGLQHFKVMVLTYRPTQRRWPFFSKKPIRIIWCSYSGSNSMGTEGCLENFDKFLNQKGKVNFLRKIKLASLTRICSSGLAVACLDWPLHVWTCPQRNCSSNFARVGLRILFRRNFQIIMYVFRGDAKRTHSYIQNTFLFT